MSRDDDRNYVSVGFWMFAMFITAIPIIGWIMILVWAFTGDNESRKNYFKAILAWLLVAVLLVVGVIVLAGVLGNGTLIHKQIHDLLQRV
ncbi:MAG: hypothetical protein EPO07_11385 [Verrucomicrobia bacterium]|nr:MAG: hypothetical protein EPO07_11385 [Verrucomicrobiota bacterium]